MVDRKFKNTIDITPGMKEYRDAKREIRVDNQEISITQAELEKKREQAAENLSRQIDAYFEYIRDLALFQNQGKNTPMHFSLDQ